VQKVIPDQDEVILLIPQGIHDRSQILTSLELMATKVMPKFAQTANAPSTLCAE
jgi:hypothetical protein